MEKFIKVMGQTFTQSELEMMNEKQLQKLIEQCQLGIEEIDRKVADYKINGDMSDMDHFNEVVGRFNAAAVYLQSDIVLINKIIKSKIHLGDVVGNDFYKKFYEVAKKNLWKRTFAKLEAQCK